MEKTEKMKEAEKVFKAECQIIRDLAYKRRERNDGNAMLAIVRDGESCTDFVAMVGKEQEDIIALIVMAMKKNATVEKVFLSAVSAFVKITMAEGAKQSLKDAIMGKEDKKNDDANKEEE